MEFKKMVMITLYSKQKKRHRCTEQTFRLCGRRWGWDVQREQHWNKYTIKGETSPAHVGCMRQVLRAGALGRPRGMGWRGRREGGPGWGTHVNPWLIHVNVWQKPLQYCKVISLQLIKINGKKRILLNLYIICVSGGQMEKLSNTDALTHCDHCYSITTTSWRWWRAGVRGGGQMLL